MRVRTVFPCHLALTCFKDHIVVLVSNTGIKHSSIYIYLYTGCKHDFIPHVIDLLPCIFLITSSWCRCFTFGRFCAHEYEKSKDMASAALAYKCTEVAYMRVIYSSHTSANRDRHELQTALQMIPLGKISCCVIFTVSQCNDSFFLNSSLSIWSRPGHPTKPSVSD